MDEGARRDAADRSYNDALTALDGAVPAPLAIPASPAPYDEDKLSSINDGWSVIPAVPPTGGGLKGRLQQVVWHVVAPLFQRQQSFNALLVEHLNRNLRHERETGVALQGLLHHAATHTDQLAAFHTRLIVFLQQITAFVDTRDRAVLADVTAVEERVRQLEAAGAELRTSSALLNQASLTMRREIGRLVGGGAPPVPRAVTSAAAAAGAVQPLESWKYVGFEDQFRGARDTIRRQLADYVPDFEGASDVLDIGCGRGELLDLLRESGIGARGVEVNHEMVELCRSRGLDVTEGDALAYLAALEDGSLGGLFAGQVVEHLEPDYLMRLLETAYHKLRPGTRVILETINPACWGAFFSSYIRDLTHVRPIHPDTLRFLLNASGFQQVEVRYRAPWPEADKIQRVNLPPDAAPELRAAMDTLNHNSDRLNDKLFSFMDYAAVGVRL